MESVTLPPDSWLPPWVCSNCGGLYGQGRDRLFRVPKDFAPVRFLLTYQQAHYWAEFNARSPYVYALCYPTGLPFYIGKGTGKRLIAHGKFVGQREPQDEKEEVIEQLQKMGVCEYYAVLLLDVTNKEALTEEAKLIIKCGRRANGGILTNRDEGNLAKEPESWDTPQQQPLDVFCVNANRWVIHPEIQYRKPRRDCVAVYCPACDYHCVHPLGVKFEEVRCPNCFRGWSVDPDSVMALYKSRLRESLEQAKAKQEEVNARIAAKAKEPAKPRAIDSKVKQSALATQENPVERAVAQIITATIIEPKPKPVVKEEKQSFALVFLLVGVIFGLSVSLLLAILFGA